MWPFRPHLDDRGIPDNHKNYKDGGRGIRTPGTVSRSTVFKTAAFNHSAIPPVVRITETTDASESWTRTKRRGGAPLLQRARRRHLYPLDCKALLQRTGDSGGNRGLWRRCPG